MSRSVSTLTVAPTGITGELVRVEAHRAGGLPSFQVVGLPDMALRESKQRVRAAIASAGLAWAEQRYTVNLSPADVPKSGSGYDLAIAVAILATQQDRPLDMMDARVHIGELGLDGSVRPVRGILPMIAAARDHGIREVVVPRACVAEAKLVGGVAVIGVDDVADLAGLYDIPDAVHAPRAQVLTSPARNAPEPRRLDLADVQGQVHAKLGLEVAAAGGHHVFFLGEPGTGKTMLAERLPTILPDLDDDDAIAATSIHSVAGTLGSVDALMRRPPWVAPHHSATMAAIVGGGSGIASPGAISMAHAGVLFLDEAPEFAPSVLDALRQPLETGTIHLHRAHAQTSYPARFQLVMAANPCPCGAATGSGRCVCTPYRKLRYLQRLSGPLMDRIDITCLVDRPGAAELTATTRPESSAIVADRVAAARDRARHRWRDHAWSTNARCPGDYFRSCDLLAAGERRLIHAILAEGRLSLRGIHRLLRVALTLADLAGSARIEAAHLSSAYTLRTTENRDECA
ncbi:YifB family Mg chelatase-like AAA ATPase [Nanchangia anserum]|uniref:YifB family Mg chelatase-like AAA ATPase n=1 Tax=Nanchangia anserum TaxID=2692125 RepID=A0A8I0GB94_9ACTO|nr:YifB family Mg chelatase-like AAA ATPase [Nanchangia anserum]MBD3688990.1 YifB family Mg chelatase-like AAA ATPase [Nanchangia anserum]QOX81239.1 YifB family Mg chelatase-like AAA ATPase [Nanchangia anserum]